MWYPLNPFPNLLALFIMLSVSPLSALCPFCDPAVLARQVCYEDALAQVLYTHKPVVPGHCLILPKRHVERYEALTDGEMLALGQLVRKVDQAVQEQFGTTGYLQLQKNGSEAGQTVPHVHIHYIPKKAGDSSSLLFLFKMYIANLKGPISPEEMEKQVSALRARLATSTLEEAV